MVFYLYAMSWFYVKTKDYFLIHDASFVFSLIFGIILSSVLIVFKLGVKLSDKVLFFSMLSFEILIFHFGDALI